MTGLFFLVELVDMILLERPEKLQKHLIACFFFFPLFVCSQETESSFQFYLFLGQYNFGFDLGQSYFIDKFIVR